MYTPKKIIELTLELLGAIDLDPCSNSIGEPNIPAKKHYTIKDDGLAQKWHGKVYLNPPYGSEISKWIQKLTNEYKEGDVTEAIALLPARTDTRWFGLLREYPRCFVIGRLQFIGAEHSAPFPSVVVYLGVEINQFTSSFKSIGDIYILQES